MEINEFQQMLKNNVSELIALQEQCQNTDVQCARSILKTIFWIKEINEDIERGKIPSSYDKLLMNSFAPHYSSRTPSIFFAPLFLCGMNGFTIF